MSRIFVGGLGSVSPAGWGVPALREALLRSEPIPPRRLEWPGRDQPIRACEAPPPLTRPGFLAHPRLRRATAVAQFAAGAAVEAIAPLARRAQRPLTVGIVAGMHSGCVQYSCRFFEEVLRNPATASPLLFPETVFAAPASHVAVIVETVVRTTTLVGDPGVFLAALAMGADWLMDRSVDVALVVSADETNWMHSLAAWHLDRHAILATGGGALALTCVEAWSLGVELDRITDPASYGSLTTLRRAARRMREQMPEGMAEELLCEGTRGTGRADAAEREAWQDWCGARIRPKVVLGDGLGAGVAWQCVAACDAIALGRHPAACVSVVGCNQQAIGVRFVRTGAAGG